MVHFSSFAPIDMAGSGIDWFTVARLLWLSSARQTTGVRISAGQRGYDDS
jgi:hypothetical protein